MNNIEKAIKETLEIKINYIDLFYAYCDAKGIDDPEEELDDAGYAAVKNEFESKLIYDDLRRLRNLILDNTHRAVENIMDDVFDR